MPAQSLGADTPERKARAPVLRRKAPPKAAPAGLEPNTAFGQAFPELTQEQPPSKKEQRRIRDRNVATHGAVETTQLEEVVPDLSANYEFSEAESPGWPHEDAVGAAAAAASSTASSWMSERASTPVHSHASQSDTELGCG